MLIICFSQHKRIKAYLCLVLKLVDINVMSVHCPCYGHGDIVVPYSLVPGHFQVFNVARRRAWYQKSCDVRHGGIMLHSQKVGLKLEVTHSLQAFILCLFGIVLQHFICYKALPFTIFTLLTTLHMDDTGHMTSDTRPSHFSCAMLKS